MSDTLPNPEPAPGATPLPKKGEIPAWLAVAIIVIAFAVVYFVYTKMTAPHVTEFKTVKHGNGKGG